MKTTEYFSTHKFTRFDNCADHALDVILKDLENIIPNGSEKDFQEAYKYILFQLTANYFAMLQRTEIIAPHCEFLEGLYNRLKKNGFFL